MCVPYVAVPPDPPGPTPPLSTRQGRGSLPLHWHRRACSGRDPERNPPTVTHAGCNPVDVHDLGRGYHGRWFAEWSGEAAMPNHERYTVRGRCQEGGRGRGSWERRRGREGGGGGAGHGLRIGAGKVSRRSNRGADHYGPARTPLRPPPHCWATSSLGPCPIAIAWPLPYNSTTPAGEAAGGGQWSICRMAPSLSSSRTSRAPPLVGSSTARPCRLRSVLEA